ncbi:hypothetical protein [Phyllobacterium ifriqiyense]|uniref:hypothetical protein n=1 Tax=Phyllobacterium ifriqiyense TaxID=314238 RepID=UPI003394B844
MNRAEKAKDRNLARMVSDPSKYDWFGSFSFHPVLKKTTLSMRVGYTLMQLADNETLAVWASQETIAILSGVASTRQVSTALKSMENVGAITRTRWQDAPPDVRAAVEKKMKRRKDSRGCVYILCLEWATETVAAYIESSPSEPTILSAARIKKTTTTADISPDRRRPVSSHFYDDGLEDDDSHLPPDGDSPPNTTVTPQGGRPIRPIRPDEGSTTVKGCKGTEPNPDAALSGLDARPASSDRINRYAEAKGKVA